ncbi:MAG: NTP transferase domain-containing protein [Candidatus Omnitrophica bacterium]|nr:NTP transferase domain-containing protein [Candidatus Omnitrophota bacterium]
MKAILLAAGVGKRMGPNAGPKCLLKIGGRSLLEITMNSLRSVGVRDLVLVVGFRKGEVAAHAQAHAREMRLTVLENPRYQEGAILSLWTARSNFDDDLLIMDADVLCPQAFFERLISSPHANCILVDPSSVNTGEEQMVLGKGSRVLFITKNPSDQLRKQMTFFGESVGFLKLDKNAAAELGRLLESRVSAGVVNIEHEQVYPDLFEKVEVGFETADGLPWIEIDTPADLDRAIRMSSSNLLCLNRRISRWFLPLIMKLLVTPNQWTTLSLGLGLASVASIARGGYGNGLMGAVLFQLFYLVDNWDGEVARAKGLSSTWGGWFDVGVDAVVQISLGLGLAVGLRKDGAPDWVMNVGWLATLGLFLDFLVTGWAKVLGFGPGVLGDSARGRGVSSDSRIKGWIRANWTNENFSLVVAAALILNGKLFFLCLLAAGVHLYWLQFLWKERLRLLYFK